MIIIQARSTSTRYPGKVMADLWGDSVISHVYTRCKDAYPLVVVAIPIGDDALREHLTKKMIPYFEGPEHDVLTRYLACAFTYGAKWVIRVTSDCPLISPAQIAWIARFAEAGIDFASNCAQGCTDGQEVEAMSWRALKWAHEKAQEPADREHVTTYVKSHLKEFEAAGMRLALYRDPWLSAGQQKCSIDTPSDLELVRTLGR